MAYNITELKVTDFISDATIKLPRFQRRQSWYEKQDFELCVSMFKGYPLGVVIYNQTKEGGRNINYLLDGRQRRSALKKLIENPKYLYDSAISYLSKKVTDPQGDIREAYWSKVGVYLNKGADQIVIQGTDQIGTGSGRGDDEDDAGSDIDMETQRGNLKLLLDLLLLVHGSQKKDITAFEKRWDFHEFFTFLPYIDPISEKVDPKELKKFIVEKLGPNQVSKDSLYTYFTTTFPLKDKKDIALSAFHQRLEETYDELLNDCNVIVSVQTNVFNQAIIGVIKINRVSSLDSQKIFSLINKGGTPLKAEELLSAKPYWNTIVKALDLDPAVRNSITELYTRLQIPGENDSHSGTFVYWDLCATFIDRIDRQHLLFPAYGKKDSELLKKVQCGFKSVAALLKDGISTVRIEELEKDQSIDLVSSLSELQRTINAAETLLLQNPFFNRFHKWNRPLSDLIGITPTWEFMAILRKLWVKLNCESGNNEKLFIRYAICLLDRLILEHARDEWKGSSDSKLSNHLKGNLDERINLMPKKEWESFLDKACASTSDDYKKRRAILYYFAVLQERTPDNAADMDYDVDHIIPQSEFGQIVEGTSVDKGLMNSLGNVSLLPRKKNESKSDKKLNELSDSLKDLVAKYSDLKIEDFGKYSNVTKIKDLVEERKRVFIDILNNKREQIMLA